MYLAHDVKVKIIEFADKYLIPKTNDEDAANWTHKLCQQLKYSFPNDTWGHKSAGPGRPHSADVICLLSPFIGWDIVTSAGSPEARLNLFGESIDLTGQIYELVSNYNWLANEIPIPIPIPPPTNETIDEKLDLIIKMIQDYHEEEMDAITADRITRIG